jgi:hypothetical protein
MRTASSVGEFVRQAFREGSVAVRDDDRRPAALGHVEPGLHRIVGGLEHAWIGGLHRAGPIEPGLHRVTRGQELFLMRDHRDLAPCHRRPYLAGRDADQQFGADAAGVEGIVRLRAVADDRRREIDHALRHVGMMIERHDDRHVRPQNLAADRELRALDVVDALRGAGAVELQRQPVDASGASQAVADARLEEQPALGRDAPARRGPAAGDRNRFDRAARRLDRGEIAADLPDIAQLLEDLRAIVEAEGAEIAHRRRHRVEVVGLLTDVDEREAHGWFSPSKAAAPGPRCARRTLRRHAR